MIIEYKSKLRRLIWLLLTGGFATGRCAKNISLRQIDLFVISKNHVMRTTVISLQAEILRYATLVQNVTREKLSARHGEELVV
jgi:hypothetical protein